MADRGCDEDLPLVTAAEQRDRATGHNGGPALDDLAPVPARRRGRPSSYSQDTAELIGFRLIDGESLRSICRDAAMPSKRTVLTWVATLPEFQRWYDFARQEQVVTIGEEVLELADKPYRTARQLALARWLIDRKKWHLGRMAPKRRSCSPHCLRTGQ